MSSKRELKRIFPLSFNEDDVTTFTKFLVSDRGGPLQPEKKSPRCSKQGRSICRHDDAGSMYCKLAVSLWPFFRGWSVRRSRSPNELPGDIYVLMSYWSCIQQAPYLIPILYYLRMPSLCRVFMEEVFKKDVLMSSKASGGMCAVLRELLTAAQVQYERIRDAGEAVLENKGLKGRDASTNQPRVVRDTFVLDEATLQEVCNFGISILDWIDMLGALDGTSFESKPKLEACREMGLKFCGQNGLDHLLRACIAASGVPLPENEESYDLFSRMGSQQVKDVIYLCVLMKISLHLSAPSYLFRSIVLR